MTDAELAKRENAPECAECDGNCCRGFYVYGALTGRPWQRKRLKDDVAETLSNVEQLGEPYYDGDQIRIDCECKHILPDGRCGIYETRPDMCRRFPCPELVADPPEYMLETCALLRRLVAESRS